MRVTKMTLAAGVVAGAVVGLTAGRVLAAEPGFGGPARVVRVKAKARGISKKGDKLEAKGKTEPPGVPLEARLVAKKATYKLDLGGKTPEEIRQLLKARRYVPAPEVDLVLEFHNTADKEIKFLVGGMNPDIPLLLKLDGPGAVNVHLPAVSSKMKSMYPIQVSLPAGKSYALFITSLRTLNVGRDGSASYWTQPGNYKLTATYKTAVSPAPKGARESRWNKNFGMVAVTSSPLKLKVVKAENKKGD
jgi:hypothetical protein